MNASEEHNPAPRSAESITYSRVSTWSKVGLGFALIALMLVAVRAWGLTHYVKVFEDFATELPQLTLWIMQVPPLGYLAGMHRNSGDTHLERVRTARQRHDTDHQRGSDGRGAGILGDASICDHAADASWDL